MNLPQTVEKDFTGAAGAGFGLAGRQIDLLGGLAVCFNPAIAADKKRKAGI
jgi:hypothetical protein